MENDIAPSAFYFFRCSLYLNLMSNPFQAMILSVAANSAQHFPDSLPSRVPFDLRRFPVCISLNMQKLRKNHKNA